MFHFACVWMLHVARSGCEDAIGGIRFLQDDTVCDKILSSVSGSMAGAYPGFLLPRITVGGVHKDEEKNVCSVAGRLPVGGAGAGGCQCAGDRAGRILL